MFLDSKTTVGTLCGIGNKAIIILARNNHNDYFYMDPHYIQESNDLDKRSSIELKKEYFFQSKK